MAINDLLSDMLTRIRNGQNARLSHISCPFSKLLSNVLNVLKNEGYIRDWREVATGNKRSLEVELKYHEGDPVIKMVKRVSTPGRRHYSSVSHLKPVFNGLGVAILSTDRGVISDNEARLQNLGGEVLCYVF
jgi:small subunit ribosomal protein S8